MSGEATIVQLPFRQEANQPPRQVGGAIQAYSSFGLDHTTVGPEFDALGLADGPRARTLEWRWRFYSCTQHDWKPFDWEGRMVGSGARQMMATQPLIGGSVPNYYVPLSQRRPTTPYRLGRKIVASFTALVFGHGRFPEPRSDDPDTQAFAKALVEAADLPVKMQRARNVGGACGTVGVSWCFHDGEPRVEVHHGKNVHVIEWEDEQERIPAHVVELKRVERVVRGSGRDKGKRRLFWQRRDWTRDADVVFREVEVTSKNPFWSVDEDQSFAHGHGRCHFVYVENLPDEEDGSVDGQPDYADNYEPMNDLDIINSICSKGAKLNLDPTLVITLGQDDEEPSAIKKGSENVILLHVGGSATYLELGGTSLEAGRRQVDELRGQILETSEAVVPDPDQVAAAGLSAVALRMLYAPALGKSDVLRHQYGSALLLIVEGMVDYVRQMGGDGVPVFEEVLDDEGQVVEETPIKFEVRLPPRVEQVVGDDGRPTMGDDGQPEVQLVEQTPGAGIVTLEWGPYFKPTAADLQSEGTAMMTAAGGKPVISQQTAVERLANVVDRDGGEEWSRVSSERELEGDALFPEPGAEGAAPEEDENLAEVITANDVRAKGGYGPLMMPGGVEDPDGYLPMVEFRAKRAAKGTAAGEQEGGAPEGGQPPQAAPGAPPAPAPGG